jgi:hypothetical protein
MATTTNYGWDTPDDTDLVKDGALAIRDLGQDVDTSLFSITSGKNVGLVHINTTSFSAQSTVNVNTVFTTDFDNYLINVDCDASSASENFALRMRVAGTDATGSNYARQVLRGTSTSVAAFRDTNTYVILGETSSSERNKWQVTVNQPAAAVKTSFFASGSNPFYLNILTTSHQLATAYDGFSIFPTSGTITGTVRTYGYRNS